MSTALGACALVVLVASLVSAWRALLSHLGEGRPLIAASAALSSLAVADVPGSWLGDLRLGAVVVVGVVVAVVVGVSAVVAVARRHAGAPPASVRSSSWTTAELTSAAVVTGLLSWCAVTSFMWDEASTHLPLANAAARGVLPLQHPAFPGQPLHYHAGYAVVVGVVRAWVGLPVDVCADVVTVMGIGLLVVGIREAVRALGAPASTAALAIVWVLCAGGPAAAWLADGWGASLPGTALFPAAWVNGATFPPLVVTNVFQHPQGAAMPITLAIVALLAVDVPARLFSARIAVAAVLVVLLARVQILFAAFSGLILAVVVVAAVVRARGHTADRAAWLLLTAVTGGLALHVGGIGSGDFGGLVWGRGYFADDGALAFVHVVLTSGVSLLALPAVWLVARETTAAQRALLWALGLVSTLGFVVGNVAVYARSWDIVKFFGVGAFCGHLVLPLAISRLPRVLAAIVVVVSCWSGALWLVRHGPLQGVIAPVARERSIDPFAARLDDACGDVVPARARVWSSRRTLWQAGWLVPGTDWRSSRDTRALLLDRERVDGDVAAWMRASRDLDAAALSHLVVDYVVVDASHAARLSPNLDAGRFQARCRSADAVVYEVRR